jgi:hypothetical protein
MSRGSIASVPTFDGEHLHVNLVIYPDGFK